MLVYGIFPFRVKYYLWMLRKCDNGVIKFVRIDIETKRKQSNKIKRQFTTLMNPHGFVRTRSTYWTRDIGDIVEFIHLHLYTFQPSYRLHLGLRVLNNDRESVALNGPDFDSCRESLRQRKLTLHFNRLEPSIEKCAGELYTVFSDIGEPWFREYREYENLFSMESILDEDEKIGLKKAKMGNSDAALVMKSRSMLGIK